MDEESWEREERFKSNQKDIVSRLRPGDLVKVNRRGLFVHWAVYIGDSMVIHVQVPNNAGSLLSTSMSAPTERATRPTPPCYYGRYNQGTPANRPRHDTKDFQSIYPNLDVTPTYYPNAPVAARYPNGAYTSPGYKEHPRNNTADQGSNSSILKKKMSFVVLENIFEAAQNDLIELGNDWDVNMKPLPPDVIVSRARSKLGAIEYHALYKNCEHFARWCRYGEEMSLQSRAVVAGLTIGPVIGGFLIGGPVGATVAGILSVGALIKNALNEKPK